MNLKYISLFVVWLLHYLCQIGFIRPRLSCFWMSFPALLKGMCYL